MFPDIIDRDAEKRLISFLDHVGEDGQQWEAVHFERLELKRLAAGDDVLDSLLERLLDGTTGALTTAIVFKFKDSDVLVAWSAEGDEPGDAFGSQLRERFSLPDGTSLGRRYGLPAETDALRMLCYRKIAGYTHSQISDFEAAAKTRKGRARAEILIVEDQPFSRKLLEAMLERTYKVYAASDAQSALELYRRHAPDVVLLDFELPDVDGDTLSGMVAALDTNCHIIMVTANSRRDAVATCRRNGVNGYILKPYSKQKIMQSIEQLTQTHDLAS
ncbi:MAG: response regulator [Alphaproteobacteria bacterium]